MEKEKTWLITGVTGQDGSYFCDLLLREGYKRIHGIIRRKATFGTENIEHIFNKIELHYGDITDNMNIHNIITKVRPDYIVNFAAQSHVKVSAELEEYTMRVNTIGVLNILQSVRNLGLKSKIYQASTSEMYGNKGEKKLNEETSLNPVSIYGISKLAAKNICDMYREAYGMFVVNSILMNHESPRRGKTFVTQKISEYVAKYYWKYTRYFDDAKKEEYFRKIWKPLELGNLEAKRDWGDAEDYMEAIYKIIKEEKPKNYVISTGETHTVREFVEIAFKEIGVEIEWQGEGKEEKGIDKERRLTVIEIKEKYYRDIEIECLIGDSTLIKKELGWEPKTTFRELVKKMVENSINKHNF